MNSKKSSGKAAMKINSNSSTGKGQGAQREGNPDFVNKFSNLDISNVSQRCTEESGWEVYGKKSKMRSSIPSRAQGSSIFSGKTGAHSDSSQNPNMSGNLSQQNTTWRSTGRGIKPKAAKSDRGWESAYLSPPPSIPPPPQNAWSVVKDSGSSLNSSHNHKGKSEVISKLFPQGPIEEVNHEDYNSEEDNYICDDSDEELLSDEYDSDECQKDHNTRKKSKWFKKWFEDLDNLTLEQINEPTRQWHCPACQNGPGAIDWYQLQPLITHAKTKGAKRVELHRQFAKLLEEELQLRGTSTIPSNTSFGKWEGLREIVSDHEIVWPPMVLIRNTLLEQDENGKWLGMGNQELLEYFNSYKATKARHSYGPQGHRGISVLIFEASAIGYLEAERLHKHFIEQGTDREAWNRGKVLFCPGGKRQLYGYLANKEDLKLFNQHSQEKSKLKFETRSYHEMVVVPMKQMSEDNQQLIWLQNEVAEEKKHSKTLEETVVDMESKLGRIMEENRIIRLRTKIQHEENKKEMDYQERYFKEQMAIIQQAMEEKERAFEQSVVEERDKMNNLNVDSANNEERDLRKEEIARFMDRQEKGIEEFESEKLKLVRIYEDKKAEMKKRHNEEEIDLEKEFDTSFTRLMENYKSHSSTNA